MKYVIRLSFDGGSGYGGERVDRYCFLHLKSL